MVLIVTLRTRPCKRHAKVIKFFTTPPYGLHNSQPVNTNVKPPPSIHNYPFAIQNILTINIHTKVTICWNLVFFTFDFAKVNIIV